MGPRPMGLTCSPVAHTGLSFWRPTGGNSKGTGWDQGRLGTELDLELELDQGNKGQGLRDQGLHTNTTGF